MVSRLNSCMGRGAASNESSWYHTTDKTRGMSVASDINNTMEFCFGLGGVVLTIVFSVSSVALLCSLSALLATCEYERSNLYASALIFGPSSSPLHGASIYNMS